MSVNAFTTLLREHSISQLRRGMPHTVQVNLGKRCNQACRHCHVDASPTRTESMDTATVTRLLQIIDNSACIHTVDITGGAPELHPDFQRIVRHVRTSGRHVMNRCNLTVLLEDEQKHTVDFLADNQVEVIASLPCYSAKNVDGQRGHGVFERSIEGLRRLNARGYGDTQSNLVLNLVYNPSGAFLPPDQTTLEQAYKRQLWDDFGIQFNHLYTITNMPIARFQKDLRKQGLLSEYMHLLRSSFNPTAIDALMCTHLVNIDWQGNLFDCDFNQMLDVSVADTPPTIWDIDAFEFLNDKNVATGSHCMGCTAGAGSSCGGAIA